MSDRSFGAYGIKNSGKFVNGLTCRACCGNAGDLHLVLSAHYQELGKRRSALLKLLKTPNCRIFNSRSNYPMAFQ